MKPTFAAGTLPRVRRLPLVVLALAFAPAAHAATLEIVPRDFSPAQTRLSIDASLSLPRLVGVELTRLNGRHVGWISRPERRQRVLLQWDGRIENAHVRDGRYLVRLMFGR